MNQRTRIRGRGIVDWPERPDLHGKRVFVLQHAPDGRLLVKTRLPNADSLGELALVPPERVTIEPP